MVEFEGEGLWGFGGFTNVFTFVNREPMKGILDRENREPGWNNVSSFESPFIWTVLSIRTSSKISKGGERSEERSERNELA